LQHQQHSLGRVTAGNIDVLTDVSKDFMAAAHAPTQVLVLIGHFSLLAPFNQSMLT
jgi:hypothetical protein